MDERYNYEPYQYGVETGAAESETTHTEKHANTETNVNTEMDVNTEERILEERISEERIPEERISEVSENKTGFHEVNFILQESPSEAEKSENREVIDKEQIYEEYKYEGHSYDDTKKEETKTSTQNTLNKRNQKNKNTRKWVTCVSMAIVFGLISSAVFQISNRVIDGMFGKNGETNGKQESVINTTPVSATADVKVLSDVSEVAENVMPSVVSITCLTVQEVQSYFFGGGYTQQYERSGSGIIIGQNDTELLIVTNNHVVEGSSVVTVTFADDTSIEAQIKGTNANIDVAIVVVPLEQIESDTMKQIKIANLGNSDELVVGEPTIAIGNALGYGQSVTTGIVSALGRSLKGLETALIQTDAAINPGNSGGALLNAAGEVIGINTAKMSDSEVEGMGYAIPISDIKEVLSELMNKKTRLKVEEEKQGTIGIEGETVNESAQRYNIPQGVYIDKIVKGGAADKAGLKEGGIITAFDGTTIKSMEELQSLLDYYEAGETVEMIVKEAGNGGKYEEKTYEITLGKQSDLN